jgi:hypothetical protein
MLSPRKYTRAVSITPGANLLPFSTSGLLATVGGTVTVTLKDGTTSVTLPILAGVILPMEVIKVTAATATGLFGLD